MPRVEHTGAKQIKASIFLSSYATREEYRDGKLRHLAGWLAVRPTVITEEYREKVNPPPQADDHEHLRLRLEASARLQTSNDGNAANQSENTSIGLVFPLICPFLSAITSFL